MKHHEADSVLPGERSCPKCGARLLPGEDSCGACLLETMLEGKKPGAGPGKELGDYELLEELGRGGQGVVYRARQRRLKRVVALKVITLGHSADESHLKRFRLEAEAVASLDHPRIVPIYEIVEHHEFCYFSMKYVEGGRLDVVAGGQALPPRRSAEILVKLARTVHFAHQHGILHRDIKPGNVLLDAGDEPHLTDFGLAKLVEKESTVTHSMEVLGTPSYMAPEQAAGQIKQLSTATDVYGLGAVLYHLLTGDPPFAGGTTYETIRLVRERNPRPPALLNSAVPRDLETICLKCLEKEPGKRYGSAEALAEDLERFLHDEPIVARPVSRPERLWLWCRRKPVVASLTGITLLLLIVIATGSTIAAVRIAREREELRQTVYASDIHAAHHALVSSNLGLAVSLLKKHRPLTRPESRSASSDKDLRGWEWRYLWEQAKGGESFTFTGHSSASTCAIFSPDGRLVATAGHDGFVHVLDFATLKQLVSLGPLKGSIDARALSFSPDSRLLATKAGKQLAVWETLRWQPVADLIGEPNWNFNDAVVFTPDSQTLATRTVGGVSFWDTKTWNLAGLLPNPATNDITSFGRVLTYSPDSRWLAVSFWSSIFLYSAGDLTDPPTILSVASSALHHRPRVLSTEFSSNYLAAGFRDGMVRVWDKETWRLVGEFQAHSSWCSALAFSPDGSLLATGGSDQVICLWRLTRSAGVQPVQVSSELVGSLHGHLQSVYSLAFSPGGEDLVSASADQTVKLWRPAMRAAKPQLTNSGYPLWVSSKLVLTADWDRRFRLRDAVTGAIRKELKPAPGSSINRSAVSGSGRRLLISRESGEIELWNVDQDKLERVLTGSPGSSFLRFSRDEQQVAAASQSDVRIWRVRDGVEERRFTAVFGPIAFSHDGLLLAAVAPGNRVQIWDLDRGKAIRSFPPQTEVIDALEFNPRNRLLAVAIQDGTLRLWDADSGQEHHLMHPHNLGAWHLAFHPDGRTLLSATFDNVVQLWHVRTGKELLSLHYFNPGKSATSFSADGNTLATLGRQMGENEGEAQVWRVPTLSEMDHPELPGR